MADMKVKKEALLMCKGQLTYLFIDPSVMPPWKITYKNEGFLHH